MKKRTKLIIISRIIAIQPRKDKKQRENTTTRRGRKEKENREINARKKRK